MLSSSKALLLLIVLQLLCGLPQRAAGQIDVHVANLTVMAVGWPETLEELQPFAAAVTSAVCGPLQVVDTLSPCAGFLVPAVSGSLSLQVMVQAASLAASALTSDAFLNWVEGDAYEMLRDVTSAVSAAAGRPLTPLSRIGTGFYTAPCRGAGSGMVLPFCSVTRNCLTSIVVTDMSGSVADSFCNLVPSPCERYIASETISQQHTMVNISDLKRTLEVALAFTDRVRRGITQAKRVQLYSNGRMAQLYAEKENMMYDTPINMVPRCDSLTGMWLLSLIAIFPILLILARYVWYQARHQTRKMERQAIIEDELRSQRLAASQPGVDDPYGGHYYAGNGTEYAQDYATEQQQYEGYDQGDGTNAYEYEQEYPAEEEAQQQHQAYDGYYQTVYDEGENATAADEYLEPEFTAGDNGEEGAYAEENGEGVVQATDDNLRGTKASSS